VWWAPSARNVWPGGVAPSRHRAAPTVSLPPQTVTFMLEGAFEHQDFAGHKGVIEAGDLQW
jgi:hypothetical protein